MPRVYRTKGPNKFVHSPTVPMTLAMRERIREESSRLGIAMTELIRRLIAKGLGTGEQQ